MYGCMLWYIMYMVFINVAIHCKSPVSSQATYVDTHVTVCGLFYNTQALLLPTLKGRKQDTHLLCSG